MVADPDAHNGLFQQSLSDNNKDDDNIVYAFWLMMS